MRVFFKGIVFDIVAVEFDLIGQMYCASLKQYKFLNHPRRENKKIGVEVRDVWIYISPSTPHIAKMTTDGQGVDEVCSEIEKNISKYIDYAYNKKNKHWVNYIANESSMFADRMEIEEATEKLDIKAEEEDYIEVFDAY